MVLRVGLFGCGRIAGFFHGPVLSRLPNVKVTALVDEVPASRLALSRRLPGATLYADWRRPIALGEIDAAVICLPPSLHAPVGIAALEAGLHVYVEKPLALNLNEADLMIDAQARAGRVGLVGFNFRFHPAYVDLKARLSAGEFGAVRGVRTLFTSAARELPGWKSARGQGGDAITDLAMHHFDLVPWLTERMIVPESISARQSQTDKGSSASVLATLEDGVPLTIIVAQTTGHGTQQVELLCEAGHVRVDPADPRGVQIEAPAGRLASVARARSALRALAPDMLLARAPDPSFERALGHFANAAARAGSASEPSFAAGRNALALARAALFAPTRDQSQEAAE